MAFYYDYSKNKYAKWLSAWPLLGSCLLTFALKRCRDMWHYLLYLSGRRFEQGWWWWSQCCKFDD